MNKTVPHPSKMKKAMRERIVRYLWMETCDVEGVLPNDQRKCWKWREAKTGCEQTTKAGCGVNQATFYHGLHLRCIWAFP